jgi:hypothetical protein
MRPLFPSALPEHDARDLPEQYNRKFVGFQLLNVGGDCCSGATSAWATGELKSGERNENRAGGSLLRAAKVD